MAWLDTILHTLGIDDTAGPWYAFWSGFGSILERAIELVVLGAILLRHKNCEIHRCWRLGRHPWVDPATGLEHRLCRGHHPLGHLTAIEVKESHVHTNSGTIEETGSQGHDGDVVHADR